MGSYVDVSTAIAEIVDNSQLHLDLFVYEKTCRLKTIQTIHFTVTNNPGKENMMQRSIRWALPLKAKAVTVHARVKSSKTRLIDGMNITTSDQPGAGNGTCGTFRSHCYCLPGQSYILLKQINMRKKIQRSNRWSCAHTAAEPHHHQGKEKQQPVVLLLKGWQWPKVPTMPGFTEITLLKKDTCRCKDRYRGLLCTKMTNAGERINDPLRYRY